MTSRPEAARPPRLPDRGPASLLDGKGISDRLDLWRWAKHDWPLWWGMFPRYLEKL